MKILVITYSRKDGYRLWWAVAPMPVVRKIREHHYLSEN